MRCLRLFFILVLLLSARLLYADLESPEQYENENIDPSRFWDFGEVKEGDVLEHIFKLINDSAEVLHIDTVSASCGCVVSEIAQKNLAPGEEAELKVKFNTSGYNGKTKQYIFITTENLNTSVMPFMIKADVKRQ